MERNFHVSSSRVSWISDRNLRMSGRPLRFVGCLVLAFTVAANSSPPVQQASSELSPPRSNASATHVHARIRTTDGGRVPTMDDVLFETASTDLNPAARSGLDELVAYLAKHAERAVLLEGHTDSIGSDVLNFSLSRRRAGAVRTYLVERGIEPLRVQTEGVGESDPVVGNATATGRRENRRVAVIFETLEQEMTPR